MGRLRYALLEVLGLNAIFRLLNRRHIVVIMYHGVCDDDFDLLRGYDERHLPRSIFRAQIEYLARKGYRFINMSELVDMQASGKRVRNAVVLTFDDGFRNIVTNVYSVLQEFQAKGCLYLVHDLIGSDRLMWTDHVETVVRTSPRGTFVFRDRDEAITYCLDTKESYESAMRDIKARLKRLPDSERRAQLKQFYTAELTDVPEEFRLASWEQIRELDRDILEIGCHTRTHPICTHLADNELAEEVEGAKHAIEEKIGYGIDHFCYPGGACDDRVIRQVMQSGFRTAVTTTLGHVGLPVDMYRIKRVYSAEDLAWFKAVVSGSYFFGQRVKAFIRASLGGNR